MEDLIRRADNGRSAVDRVVLSGREFETPLKRRTRLSGLLDELKDRRERLGSPPGAWSPAQAESGTLPVWKGESDSVDSKSEFRRRLAEYSARVREKVLSNASIDYERTDVQRANYIYGYRPEEDCSRVDLSSIDHVNASISGSPREPSFLGSPSESRPPSGVVKTPNIAPLTSPPRRVSFLPARKAPTDRSPVSLLSPTEFSKSKDGEVSLSASGSPLRTREHEPIERKRRAGIRAPDLDASSDEEEQEDVKAYNDAHERINPFVHLGGSARGKEIYTWDKSTWLEQEHSHIERIEEFVQLLRRNRTIVENELRAELSELETQAFAIKEESLRNSGPELSSKRSAALYEDWKSKRRQQDADRVGRFKQLYSERIQEHQDRQRDLQAEKEKQQKLAAEKAQKEAEDKKERERMQAARDAAQKKKQLHAARVKAKEEEYLGVIRALEEIQSKAEVFKKDSSMSKVRLQLKKGVNLNINQIAASQKQVQRISTALKSTLDEASRISPEAVAFTENLIAERLVAEGQGQVMLHVHSAFPIAAVAVFLTGQYPQLANVILGQFYKVCPYTIPRQVHRVKGQTEEEYRMAIGYLEGETTDQYYERMVGYLSLYSAIMQTDLRAFGIQNPIGIEKAWTWLAKTVNSKTRRITATLLITFLEICGYEMHRTYRLQFSKLVKLICNQLIPTFPRDSPPGPTTRIVVFGEEYARGQLDPPKGKQLPQRDLEYT